MKTTKSQSGFSIFEVMIIIAMLAIIGFLGYAAYNSFVEANKSVDSSQEAVENNVNNVKEVVVPEAPATVESSADLDEVNSLLDEIDLSVDSDDDTTLDSELSNF